MTSTPTLTIGARDLIALVDATIPFAGTDQMMPVLNAVHIESRGTHLLAMATDRYRLGIQRLAAPDGSPWPEFEANIPLRSLRSIKAMFKPMRGIDSTLTLTIDENRLTVEADGALMEMLAARATYFLSDGEFPKVAKVVQDAIEREPESKPFTLNASLLKSLATVGGRSMTVKGHPNKPILFSDGEDFVGIIMPRRAVGADDGVGSPSLADWGPLLIPPVVEDKPAKKAAPKAKAVA